MQLIHLAGIDSTNSALARMADQVEAPALLIADSQTAGRGQRGNTWEAEPGMNITISLLFRQIALHPRHQFALSRAVSLAIIDSLNPILMPTGLRALIKWPNDIYVDDSKLAGILIENTIASTSIVRSIVGLGLNVNQTLFLSDAPNPVSLKQLLGHGLDVMELAGAIGEKMVEYVDAIKSGDDYQQAYVENLWRRRGNHRYRDAATGEVFMASIDSIDTDGRLHLRPADGTPARVYYFKEVSAIV